MKEMSGNKENDLLSGSSPDTIDLNPPFFRYVVDAIGDAVSIQDRNYRVLYQNEAHRRLVGSHVGELCYKAYNSRDTVCTLCPLVKTFEDGKVHIMERPGLQDKGILSIETTSSALRNSAGEIIAGIEVVRDTTERKRIMDALQAEEAKFRTLVEQSLIGIFILQNDRFPYINPRAASIFGYRPDEIIGKKTFRDLIAPEMVEQAAENIRLLLSGATKVTHSIRKGIRKDSAPLDLEIEAAVIEFNGSPAIIGTLLDITDQTAAKAYVQQAKRLESLGGFAGDIANEFNNILTAIIGNLAIAKMYAKPGYEVHDVLVEAETASFRAQELTTQLLRFADSQSPMMKTVLIGDALRELVSVLSLDQEKAITIESTDDLLPVHADEGLLLEAFRNIFMHALRASAADNPVMVKTMNITGPQEALSPVGAQSVRVLCEYRSAAPLPQPIEKIFDPFYDREGGLELPQAHTIMTRHGAMITAKSYPGNTVVFEVSLPVRKDLITKPEDFIIPSGQMKGSILVMDDEELVRLVVSRLLLQCGYEATTVRNGEDMLAAYDNARASGKPFAAVILDLVIVDGMGGQQAIGHLLDLDPNARAIVSSGYSTDPAMTDHLKYGFKAFLPKPYRLEDMRRVLHEVIGR